MTTYISNSETDTENIAYKFAHSLKSNCVIVLSGELGSGKTKFVKGIAKYFGIENDISSPTFTIVNEHMPKINCDRINNIFHFDVYRLNGSEDFLDSIGTEYFENGICIIEWGEIIKDILPDNTIYISFSKNENEPNLRIIEIESGDNK